jgi:hypothetical protein
MNRYSTKERSDMAYVKHRVGTHILYFANQELMNTAITRA